jgi:hypothetical protein
VFSVLESITASMRRRVGLIVFLLGLLIAAWIVYSLFVARTPQASSQNAMPAIVVAVGFLFFGYLWMKR